MLPMNMMPPQPDPMAMPPQAPPQTGGMNPILMMLIQMLIGGGPEQMAPPMPPMPPEMPTPMTNFPPPDMAGNQPNYQELARRFAGGRNV